MMNKNERMEMLKKAGIDTGKYFTVDLDNGTKIHLIIDENGNIVKANEKVNDHVANQIIEDGYVRNTKLHRRFVMAQMFHMLNYVSWNGNESGYTACLRNMYGYDYTLKMMLEEVRVLSKLEVRDKESFDERSHFFTKAVVVAVLKDHVEKVKAYVNGLPNHNCKGIPYKKVKGQNIFNADLHKKVYAPMLQDICSIQYARNYNEMYRKMCVFMSHSIKLPYNTPKSKAWIDAYKGEGAYYTLKNLIMFHGCFVETPNQNRKYGAAGIDYVEFMLDQYKGQGWRMFALMKKVIADNNFDFNKRMAELGK